MKKLLIVGHTFPEPSTTAAGNRMMQLIDLFIEDNFNITFASTATISERSFKLEDRNIPVKNILLNDPSFDTFIAEVNPDVVMFDRFITEEQFGWRVSEVCPNAVKILDTEDLHFLRRAREEAIKKNMPITEANLFSEDAKREIASIMRCDLSIIISEIEMDILEKKFKIPSEILFYLPFLSNKPTESSPDFKSRKHFVSIGNLLHAPNVDAVLQLKKVWPAILEKLPNAEVHVYGAYAPQQVLELHNEKEGFLIKGWIEDLDATLEKYRLQLAFIRFGAGLKGKLVDAMRCGLPSITTEVGVEGLCGELSFGGKIVSSYEEFVNSAVELYSEEQKWKSAQKKGFQIIVNRFEKKLHFTNFLNKIQYLSINLKIHRDQNFLGQVLQHQTLRATKYLSKWIETKNSPLNSSPICYAYSDEVRKEYKS